MFGFPIKERGKDFQYKQNFLKTVIFQIKYDKVSDILQYENKLDSLLVSEYPIKKKIMQGGVLLKFEKTPILLSKYSDPGGFEYRSETGNQIFSVTSDTINFTILGNEYTNFNKVFSNYNIFIKQILDEFCIRDLVRIAIRKINIFEFLINENQSSPIDFLHIIFKEQLINNLLFFRGKTNVISGLTKLDFIEMPYKLKLSYGLLEKPGSNKNYLATIDIDIFNSQTKTSFKEFPLEMEKLNQEIFNIFEYMITDNIRDLMNEEGVKNANSK